MDYAYIAGLLDGEGSILLTPQGRGHPRRPQLSIGMTDREPIEAVHEAVGGFVRVVERQPPCAPFFWVWRANGSMALEVLSQIRPHLTMTRRQRLADLLLHDYPRERGGLRGVRGAQIERIFEEMRKENAVRQPQVPRPPRKPTDADCAYLAGIIDGEGHIASSLRTEVWSTDPEMLDWCQSRFGGAVVKGRNAHGAQRETWRWLRAPTSFPRIADVAGHMRLPAKRELVQKMENFSRTPTPPRPLDPESVAEYHRLRAEGIVRTVAAREAGIPMSRVAALEGCET